MNYQVTKIHGGEPYTQLLSWKKLVWKGFIIYNPIYVKFWKMQNYGDSHNISGYLFFRKWGGGVIGGYLGIFRAVKPLSMML